MWDHVIANTQSAASKLHVKSALNPMLWLCGIVSLPCFIMAYLLSESLMALAFLSMGAIPVAATIFGFLWFMIKEPEKLQSEEYQLRHEAIDVIRQKRLSVRGFACLS